MFENSITLFEGLGRDKGRGPGRDRNSLGEHGYGDNGSRHCAHYGRNNHISDKCWDKFGKPEWAQVADCTSLQLLSPPLLLLLYRSPRHTIIIFFIFRLLSYLSQLIVLCMGLLQVWVHLLFSLIRFGF